MPTPESGGTWKIERTVDADGNVHWVINAEAVIPYMATPIPTPTPSPLPTPTPAPVPTPTPTPTPVPVTGWDMKYTSQWVSGGSLINRYIANATKLDAVALGIQNNGTFDCTALINSTIALFDSTSLAGIPYNGDNKYLYFPNGTYRISGQIRGDWNVLLVGESMDGVIFRLDDNASGFGDRNNPKAAIKISHGNHDSFRTYLQSFTVEVGSGNVGAIGVAYCGHNHAGIRNLRIKDLGNTAYTGLALGNYIGNDNFLSEAAVGTHAFENVVVDGFDTGVSCSGGKTHCLALFDLTVKNQRSVGFSNQSGGAFGLTNFKSLQTLDIPAISQTAKWEDGIISGYNCTLTTTASTVNNPAILIGNSFTVPTNNQAPYYFESVTTTGYTKAITVNGNVRTLTPPYSNAKRISGQDQPQIYRYSGSTKETATVFPVLPELKYYQPLSASATDWAIMPEDANTSQIQAAFNSGKPCVTGLKRIVLTDPVTIPTTVKLWAPMVCGVHYADSTLLDVDNWLITVLGGPTDEPLEIRNLNDIGGYRGDGGIRYLQIRNIGGRPMILRESSFSGIYLAGNTPSFVLMDQVCVPRITIGNGWKVYSRNLDTESQSELRIMTPSGSIDDRSYIYMGNDAELYIDGWKSENPSDFVRAGDRCIVGARANMHASNQKAMGAKWLFYTGAGCTLSYSGGFGSGGGGYALTQLVREMKGATESFIVPPGMPNQCLGRPIPLVTNG